MKRSPREIKEAKKAYDKVVDHLTTEELKFRTLCNSYYISFQETPKGSLFFVNVLKPK